MNLVQRILNLEDRVRKLEQTIGDNWNDEEPDEETAEFDPQSVRYGIICDPTKRTKQTPYRVFVTYGDGAGKWRWSSEDEEEWYSFSTAEAARKFIASKRVKPPDPTYKRPEVIQI